VFSSIIFSFTILLYFDRKAIVTVLLPTTLMYYVTSYIFHLRVEMKTRLK